MFDYLAPKITVALSRWGRISVFSVFTLLRNYLFLLLYFICYFLNQYK